MSSTYIAAYDGTPTGRAAVQFAKTLAAADDADVVAVHVAPPVPGLEAADPVASRVARTLDDAMRVYAEHTLGLLDVDGVTRRLIRAPSPAAVLREVAETEHAAVIVVGLRDHPPLGRLVPGSIAMQLLHSAPCPVVVVPETGVPAALEAIGVADDDSDESRAAPDLAEALAERLGARLVPLAAATVDPSPRGVDLVVTGSAHHEPEAGVWASPLSSRLVDRAPCPVLVTPPRVGAEAVPAGQPVTA